MPTINLFRCHPPKECFLCSPFQTPFPRRFPHSQAGRMQLSRLQATQAAGRSRENTQKLCNLPNYGDLRVFFKLRRVRFEPWRGNYKRVKRLGWFAWSLSWGHPPDFPPNFCRPANALRDMLHRLRYSAHSVETAASLTYNHERYLVAACFLHRVAMSRVRCSICRYAGQPNY